MRKGPQITAHLREVLRQEQARRIEEHAATQGLTPGEAARALAAVDLERPSLIAPALPEEARVAAADPAHVLDDLVLVRPLGRGGGGEVWRAWDAQLGRWVAVKLPAAIGDDRGNQDRFGREALAIARLDHPNILALHRLGRTAGGRPYLVMPLVDGRTLDHVTFTPRQAVEIIHTVALAIAHAHARGVTHRDLKPGNIMLADDGRVFVLDFGLVYLQEDVAALVTAPGDVVGTAAYLSPEQAQGTEASRRPAADIYGLGATLFHLLAGRPPFVGATMAEVIKKVLDDQPPSLRTLVPDLPAGLEHVVSQCLQKSPERRYPSAEALAEDLARVLREQTVQARPPRRKLPRWLPVVGAALAAIVIARELIGQRRAALETARAMVQVSLNSALRLRRAGDMAGMRNVLPDLLQAYEAARRQGVRSAELESLVGRVHRVLADEKRALEHQERALAAQPDHAPALYERALLRTRAYGRELERARALAPGGVGSLGVHRPGAQEPAARLAQLEPLRQSIVRDLAAIDGAGLSAGAAELAAGLLAFHEGDLGRALPLFEKATAIDAQNGDAWEALAKVAYALGDRTRAEEACSAGLRIDAGHVALLTGRCQVRTDRGADRLAEEDATRALALIPGLAEAHLCRGIARGQRAHAALLRGEDTEALFAQADEDLARAAVTQPDSPGILKAQGVLSRYRALARFRHGGDPRPELSRAEAVFGKAIQLAPQEALLRTQRGRARWLHALYLHRTGGDPQALLDAAEGDLTEASRLDGKRMEGFAWRADVHALRAVASRTVDPAAAFAAAEADFARAVEYPHPWPRVHRAAMRIERARLERGPSADSTRAAAAADLTYALRKLTTDPDPLVLRARLVLDNGCTGAGPADADLTRALSLNPRHAEAWVERGRLLRCRGDRQGAEAAFERALQIDANLTRTVAEITQGRWVRSRETGRREGGKEEEGAGSGAQP